MTTGERIRTVRQSKNLTQKQLGELAGIAEPTIRRYELGKLNPKIETIAKIASAMNTPTLSLLGDAAHVQASIGENIKRLRIEHGMTQEQLAAGCGLATITIRQYESGKREPRYDTVEKMEAIFRTSTGSILNKSGKKYRVTQWTSRKDAHLSMPIDAELLQTIQNFADADGLTLDDEVEKLLVEYTDILSKE